MTYERVGDEELTDLTPLCRKCHAMVHELERRGEIALDFQGIVSMRRAARYKIEGEPRRERVELDSAEIRERLEQRQMEANVRKAVSCVRQTMKEGMKYGLDLSPRILDLLTELGDEVGAARRAAKAKQDADSDQADNDEGTRADAA